MAIAMCAVACRSRVPDVGVFRPVLEEDGRLVEILMEADALAERDMSAAARNLRQIVVPRARANWEAAGRIVVSHPRAQALLRELRRVTDERASSSERYAVALEQRDAIVLHDAMSRMRELDQAMDRLNANVQAASRAPADRGCAAR